MRFHNRRDAGRQLSLFLKLRLESDTMRGIGAVVFSLLRGGAPVGQEIASKFKLIHYPLVSVKISAPQNPELAIGAVCLQALFLEKAVINRLGLSAGQVKRQVDKARQKQKVYVSRFKVDETVYRKLVPDRLVIVADDGIATGSTIKAAVNYLSSCRPHRIIAAVPIVPASFVLDDAETIALHKPSEFGAISQFYQNFPSVSDSEVKSVFAD